MHHRLSTLDDLLAQQHSLALYCAACDRWVVADLGKLSAGGRGGLLITRTRFRCSVCGDVAEKQLRPPVPRPGHAVAWIGPA